MKKTILALIVVALFQLSCNVKQIPKSLECQVLNKAINDILREDSLSEIIIVSEYRKWDINLDLKFQLDKNSGLPFYEPPKSKEERLQRLNSDIFDPYPMFYVFALPFTDTIFSADDRKFMEDQVRSDTTKYISCNLSNVKLVSLDSGQRKGYLFFKPLFSKDLKYAIIRKYTSYELAPVNKTLYGELQTSYYYFDEKSGWRRIYKGLIFL